MKKPETYLRKLEDVLWGPWGSKQGEFKITNLNWKETIDFAYKSTSIELLYKTKSLIEKRLNLLKKFQSELIEIGEEPAIKITNGLLHIISSSIKYHEKKIINTH